MTYTILFNKTIFCELCLNERNRSKSYKTSKKLIYHLRTQHNDLSTYIIEDQIRKIKELIK